MSAVATVRTAGGYIFLSVEGNSAIAAATAYHGNSYFIYKHFHSLSPPVFRNGLYS